MQLAFPISAHQNTNQKPIGSELSYQVQCTLPLQPIYQTLLSIFPGSGLETISFLFWSIQAQMNLITIYFYGFSTHGTVVCITLVMQFSHCYCFASEREEGSICNANHCLVWCANPLLVVQFLRRGYMKQEQPQIDMSTLWHW